MKFLCKIGWHKWEAIESNNTVAELLILFMAPWCRRVKCKYCGKEK